jgi:hypothetical protein
MSYYNYFSTENSKQIITGPTSHCMPYFVKIEITVSVRRTMKKYDNITVVYLQDMKASITSKLYMSYYNYFSTENSKQIITGPTTDKSFTG